MKVAYIIENGLKVSEVCILDEAYGTCLVRFHHGGGMRISSKRLYGTKEEAEKVLEGRRGKKIEEPVIYSENKTFHSPHYYGWG